MKKLLICDLDNTVYDWVGYFAVAFYAMVDEAVNIVQCDREKLLDDLRAVHIKNRDSEHPFSLLDASAIREKFPGLSRAEIAIKLDPAFHAFNSARKRHLKLYPGVYSCLESLKSHDILLIAHTEGKLYSILDRLNRLDIKEFFSRIYCRERSEPAHPNPRTSENWLRKFDLEKVVELS